MADPAFAAVESIGDSHKAFLITPDAQTNLAGFQTIVRHLQPAMYHSENGTTITVILDNGVWDVASLTAFLEDAKGPFGLGVEVVEGTQLNVVA